MLWYLLYPFRGCVRLSMSSRAVRLKIAADLLRVKNHRTSGAKLRPSYSKSISSSWQFSGPASIYFHSCIRGNWCHPLLPLPLSLFGSDSGLLQSAPSCLDLGKTIRRQFEYTARCWDKTGLGSWQLHASIGGRGTTRGIEYPACASGAAARLSASAVDGSTTEKRG